MTNRNICDIAKEIETNWERPYFGAVPYIKAMKELRSIDDMYMWDTAKSIVLYFLGNASTWRGETARRIKQELKTMVKDKDNYNG